MATYLNWDTQWPAPAWYHVPTKDEWQAVYDAWVSLRAWTVNRWDVFGEKMKMPRAGSRRSSSSDAQLQGSDGIYWSSTAANDANYSYGLSFNSSSLNPEDRYWRGMGLSLRCFKNTPLIPTSSWTTIYAWSNWAWIYHNTSEWAISISSDWQTWITIADKNLWATTVYNNWDKLSEANCWYYYQWWNNYGFPRTWTVTTLSTTRDASSYWPWEYYSSSIFRTTSPWDSSDNRNLWWWVTDLRPETPDFSNAWLFRYEESDTEYTNPLKPTQTITIAPAGYPAITETVWSYLDRVASWWKEVSGYKYDKIALLNHHWDVIKEVDENYIPTLSDFEDEWSGNSLSICILFINPTPYIPNEDTLLYINVDDNDTQETTYDKGLRWNNITWASSKSNKISYMNDKYAWRCIYHSKTNDVYWNTSQTVQSTEWKWTINIWVKYITWAWWLIITNKGTSYQTLRLSENTIRLSWWTLTWWYDWWQMLTLLIDAWNVTVYRNWELIWTSSTLRLDELYKFILFRVYDTYYCWALVKEVIVEEKQWSVDYISNYFNITKSLYWIWKPQYAYTPTSNTLIYTPLELTSWLNNLVTTYPTTSAEATKYNFNMVVPRESFTFWTWTFATSSNVSLTTWTLIAWFNRTKASSYNPFENIITCWWIKLASYESSSGFSFNWWTNNTLAYPWWWTMIAVTKNWTSFNLYLFTKNWLVKSSYTISWTASAAVATIWWQTNNTTMWWIWDVIAENKVWTETELNSLYNTSKLYYWYWAPYSNTVVRFTDWENEISSSVYSNVVPTWYPACTETFEHYLDRIAPKWKKIDWYKYSKILANNSEYSHTDLIPEQAFVDWTLDVEIVYAKLNKYITKLYHLWKEYIFDERVSTTWINVSPTSINLTKLNQTAQITASVIPSNADDKKIIYTSSAPSIVSVSSTGLVKALGEGNATITVKSNEGGFSKSVSVVSNFGWKPWSNTVWYRPLNSSTKLTDYQWKNAFTWYSSSATYNSWTFAWVECLNITDMNYWRYWLTSLSWYPTWWTSRTFSIWCYLATSSWSTYNWAFSFHSGSVWVQALKPVAFPIAWKIWWDWASISKKWTLLTFTYTSWVNSFYVNWELIWTYNGTQSTQSISSSYPFRLWHNINATWGEWWYWGLSNLIIENKARTQEEVTSYFNSTKSNYWL